MRKKWLVWLGYVLLIPSLVLNLFLYNKKQNVETTYLVKEVFDGDTFVTDDQIHIRLANLDAPAIDLCGGQEAKQFLEKLILNKRVRLEVFGQDVFKRQLAYVYINGQMANQLLLEAGWGEYERGGKVGVKELLNQAYALAKEGQKGINGLQCTQLENLESHQCIIKGNVGKDDKSKIYHFPGCRDYETIFIEKFRGDQWFCSEAEAQAAGFVKSKNCYGRKFNKE